MKIKKGALQKPLLVKVVFTFIEYLSFRLPAGGREDPED